MTARVILEKLLALLDHAEQCPHCIVDLYEEGRQKRLARLKQLAREEIRKGKLN